MKHCLKHAIDLAETDRDTIARDLAAYEHRLGVARQDVAFYANHADRTRVALNDANRLIGAAYLRLMTSGISHRAYMAYVKRQEARHGV